MEKLLYEIQRILFKIERICNKSAKNPLLHINVLQFEAL
jgi:hypothetical protein